MTTVKTFLTPTNKQSRNMLVLTVAIVIATFVLGTALLSMMAPLAEAMVVSAVYSLLPACTGTVAYSMLRG